MNIAFIGKYNDDQVNGVLNSGFQLAKALVGINVNVFFYYCDFEERNFQDDHGIQHRVFRESRMKFFIPESFEFYLRTNPDRINVFHLHSVFIINHYAIARILSRKDFPYVITPHGGYNSLSLERTLLQNTLLKKIYIRLFERYVVNRSKGMVAVTQREVEDLRFFGFKGRIKVIPNAVSCPADDELSIQNKKIILLFLGRYDIQVKGLMFLLETFKLISSVRKDVLLVMHGEGKDKDKLLQIVKDEHIENIEIGEPVFGVAKNEVIKNCTLYFQPSRSEAFGMSMAEAMSYAKSVVVTNESYISPFLQLNQVGLTVAYEPNIAAREILEFLNNRRALNEDGIRCRQLVEREFRPERIAKSTLAFYQQVYGDTPMISPFVLEDIKSRVTNWQSYLNNQAVYAT